MPKMNLDQKAVDAMPLGERAITWDASTPGFGVVVGPKGKSYIVNVRISGKERREVIGATTAIRLKEARAKAVEIIGKSRQPGATEARPTASTVTFKQACEDWIETGGRGGRQRAVRTITDYRYRCERTLYPALGATPLRKITKGDVNALLTGLGSRERDRSYALTIIKAVFNHAVARRWLTAADENPARGIRTVKTKGEQRVLEPEDVEAFGRALRAMEERKAVSPWLAGLFRVSLLCGLRPGEAQSLAWENVDLDRRRMAVIGKTGRRDVLLTEPAIEALRAVPRIEGVPWVFAGRLHGKHIVGVNKQLARVCTEAGLKPFSPYTFRHSAATLALAAGADVRSVQALLGHADLATTANYLHSTEKRQRGAAEKIAGVAKGL